MRLSAIKSKNTIQFYIIKSVTVDGKTTSKIIEKLGNLEHIQSIIGPDADPYAWGRERALFLTQEENKSQLTVNIPYSNSRRIEKNQTNIYNGGYLFIKKIFYELKLDLLAKEIAGKYKIEFDLTSILHDLICSRIIYPSSKQNTFEESKKFLEKHDYDLHQVYRALDIIAKEDALIQKHLYKNSVKIIERNTQVLYYDCTNFYFEIQESEGLKQYGKSKENRPNPIVEMGLFMDGNGIPLGFSIHPGNTNEQVTLRPLETQIIQDYELSNLIVCTDAGLSSKSNKQFNSISNRDYITVQSLKKLKLHLKEWALNPKGWRTQSGTEDIDISDIELVNNNSTYYKERWINENRLEERLIISFSPKYKLYQESIRGKQIDRASKIIDNKSAMKKTNPNDPKRFIKQTPHTTDGEVASETEYSLDILQIEKEKSYDGFYGIVTSLDDPVQDIITVNQRRWEIEETFRIMKSEFRARPVYLKRDNRIKAHFMTCYIAMVIYRILESRLEHKYSSESIVKTLRDMNLLKVRNEGYIPAYSRTDVTDALHSISSFNLDTEIIDHVNIRKIKKICKTRK